MGAGATDVVVTDDVNTDDVAGCVGLLPQPLMSAAQTPNDSDPDSRLTRQLRPTGGRHALRAALLPVARWKVLDQTQAFKVVRHLNINHERRECIGFNRRVQHGQMVTV